MMEDWRGPLCEHCGKPGAHYYEVAGVVFTYLCPPCRTDLQAAMLGEVGSRDWWIAIARRNQAMADPLMMGTAADDLQEFEERMHGIVAWIRTKAHAPGSDSGTMPAA